MKSILISSTVFLAAASLMASDKDDVKSAVEKLNGADNYSWTTTMEIANSQFTPGPSHGKTQKDGLVWMDMTFQDNTMEAYAKGGKGAVKTDDGWEAVDLTAAPARGGGGGGGFNPAMMMGMRLRNFKAPGAQVADMMDKMTDITKSGEAYKADLTEEGAKSLATFGRRGGGGGGGGRGPAPVSNAKGSVKFWVKDGVLDEYELKVSGTRKNQDGDDMDFSVTTKVKIKDVGTTKLAVPDEAQKKMTS